MKTQNLTISLPEDIVKEARQQAVDKGMSLSKFVAKILSDELARRSRYLAAREEALRELEEGLDLGTHGKITWTRDSLYER